MAVKMLLVAGLLLASALSACGGGKDVPLVDGAQVDGAEGAEGAEGGEPSTSISPLLPGVAAEQEGGGAAESSGAAEGSGTADGESGSLQPASCDPAECPEVLLFGVMVPGCCRFGNLCGGRVQVSERTSACLAPEVNEQGEELRSALTRAAQAPFVTDLGCPSQVIDGDELRGCCRAGLCGLDTEPWTRSAASFGLVLPRACLDAREAAELADQPASNAPPRRCE